MKFECKSSTGANCTIVQRVKKRRFTREVRILHISSNKNLTLCLFSIQYPYFFNPVPLSFLFCNPRESSTGFLLFSYYYPIPCQILRRQKRLLNKAKQKHLEIADSMHFTKKLLRLFKSLSQLELQMVLNFLQNSTPVSILS